MFRTTTFISVAVLCVALLLAIFIEEHRLKTAHDRAASAALAVTNTVADHDTTRITTLGDSLDLAQKQVIQSRQERDRIDAALGAERRASYGVRLTIDSLSRVASAPSRVDSTSDSAKDLRYADFELHQEPYTVSAQVSMPAPPDSARIALRISLDSLRLVARVGCAPPDNNGARAAKVGAVGPAWAAVRFDRVEQDPGVCNATITQQPSHDRSFLRNGKLVLGLGRVFAGRQFAWGGFIDWGWLIWT